MENFFVIIDHLCGTITLIETISICYSISKDNQMPFNLIETIKNYFNEEFTNKASSVLGENQQGISKALSAIIPIELAGILNKATSGPEGAADIYQKAKSATSIFSAAPFVAEDTAQNNSETVSLFGSNQPAIINAVSGFAGIKSSSTESLLSIGLPAILGILVKHAEEKKLSDSGLSGFLASQKDHIMQAIPAGLSPLASTLGLSSSTASTVHPPAPELISSSDEPINRNNWVVPLIFIIIVIGLIWYFSRSCNQTKPSPASDSDNVMIITSQPYSPVLV